MRFTENGPSIPDALLQARDEGRVVVFCGAGVSRARAGMPDFFGLAESVIHELGVPSDSDACKVLRKAREIGEELDIPGLISADRVFSLLEREFTSTDIQSAVAKCLAPVSDVDRSAHEILLRLAQTPEGKTQIVTTNFDRLFESEAEDLQSYQPPRLPDLARHDELNGIVYLHGRVNNESTGADVDGFVLSSSDFGHAYLSEAWATEFFREVVRGYVVIFIGYSADDPPVQYLLEGLRRSDDSLNHIYAFQSDESDELITRWRHKGVVAIPYSPADGHRALWEALEQWAIRADDPQAWQQSVLKRAMAGPRKLEPHERGQVAHVVSTHEGARAFAEFKPPAEWLCVFDPLCRYESPGQLDRTDSESRTVDPFLLYGLDSDRVPQRDDPDSHAERRSDLTDAWDAFVFNTSDRLNLLPENFAAVRGHHLSHMPRLPKRLEHFGTWIANVVNQPAAVWWAARQRSLHPEFRRNIDWKLSQFRDEIDGTFLKVWEYILEAWNHFPVDDKREWIYLRRDLERDGWSLTGVRRFVELNTPFLKVGPALLPRPVPPQMSDDCSAFDLVEIDVECPVPPDDADIPNEWLHHVVRGLRTNIEASVRLCVEVDYTHRLHISPILEDDQPEIRNFQRTHGLSGCVITFASLFDRLVEFDLPRAKEEFSAWPWDDDSVFSRLRLWASGKRELATPHAFCLCVRGLSDEVFWGSYHQRDFLLVLKSRWEELSNRDRRQIETRLLRGPDQWEGEEDDSYGERRAWAVLDRLQWLRAHGCEFAFDVDAEMAARRSEAPNWKTKCADRAAESRETRGGFVRSDTQCGPLIRQPIASVLSKAFELSGQSDTNILEVKDPFVGLCAECPRRAYLALAHAARQNEYPAWAWKTFLDSSAKKQETSRFSAIIAARLCRMSDSDWPQLLHQATWWFQKVSKALSKDFPDSFDQTVQRFIDVLQHHPASVSSSIHDSNRGRDWVFEAINSPVGHVVQAILSDVRNDAQAPVSINPCLERLEQCLVLSGDLRRYAIAVASYDLDWLYRLNRQWTERHLLSILDADDDGDCESLWAGVFGNPRISNAELYLRMKDRLLEVAKLVSTSGEGHAQSLACLTLHGWVSPEGNGDHSWVTDAELRDVLLHGGDELRSHVLWQFGETIRSDEPAEREKWQTRASEFFQNVWPRQKSVKTSKMTIRLCELLLSNGENFAKLIDLVLPLLTTISDGTGLHIDLRSEVDELVKADPGRFLRLLDVVLSDNVQDWPYGIGNVLVMIAEADDTLLGDSRLIELRRKWNAR